MYELYKCDDDRVLYFLLRMNMNRCVWWTVDLAIFDCNFGMIPDP